LTKKLPKLFCFSSLNNKRNKNEIGKLDKIYGKKEELSLKKSNSKLSLEMVSKAETLPSTISPEDEKTNVSSISTESKGNQDDKKDKISQEKELHRGGDKENKSIRKSVSKLMERKMSREVSKRKELPKDFS
jgi:hypothetical protein